GVRLGAERLALVERERVREVVTALLDDRGHTLHRRGPLEGRATRPLARGRVRRCDRPPGIVSRPLGDGADRLTRRRARRLDPPTGFAPDPASPPVLRLFGHPGP